MRSNGEAVYTTKDFRRYVLRKVWSDTGRYTDRSFRRYELVRVWI